MRARTPNGRPPGPDITVMPLTTPCWCNRGCPLSASRSAGHRTTTGSSEEEGVPPASSAESTFVWPTTPPPSRRQLSPAAPRHPGVSPGPWHTRCQGPGHQRDRVLHEVAKSAWASARWPSSTTASCWRALARLSRAFTWAFACGVQGLRQPLMISLHHEHGQPQGPGRSSRGRKS